MYGRTPAASNRRLQAQEFVQLLGLSFFAMLMNECVVLQADKFWIAGLVFTKFMPLGLDLGTFAKQFLQRLLASSRLPSVLPHGSILVSGDGFSWNCLLGSLLKSAEPVHYSLKSDKKTRTLCEDQCKYMIFFCLFWARQPPVGQDLLIHEASRSHTTTHHIR